MKKRMISWILALGMVLALVPVQAMAIGGSYTPAERYARYLVKEGGYGDIVEVVPNKKGDMTVESVLVDVDGDGIQEALVHLSGMRLSEFSGYCTFSALLDLEQDQVKVRMSRKYGPGTAGGQTIQLKYDQLAEEYVIAVQESRPDGIAAGRSYLQLYSGDGQVATTAEYHHFLVTDKYYKAEADRVKSETSLYEINQHDEMMYWKIDGRYVSKSEYQELMDRYVNPAKDSDYAMHQGTYDKPIKIKTVPKGYAFEEDSFSFGNYDISKISKKYFTTMYGPETGKLLYREHKELGNNGVCFGMAYVTAAIWNNLPPVNHFVNERLGEDQVVQTIRGLKLSSKMPLKGGKISLEDYIKYAHIYQLSSDAESQRLAHNGDHDDLVQEVLRYLEEDQLGLTISMRTFEIASDGDFVYDSNGQAKAIEHMVLAVGIEGDDILINDPNKPSGFARLTYNGPEDWTYSEGNVSSKNTILSYHEDVETPYMTLVTGTTVTSDLVDGENQTTVIGMSLVDADKVLLAVDYDDYQLPESSVLPITVSSGFDDVKTNLYWVKTGKTITVSNLSGGEGLVHLAGGDTLMTVGASDGSTVTMTVSDSYTGLLLKSTVGEACTISLENTTAAGEDLVLTVEGTVDSANVVLTTTDSGICYSGMSDVTVTLTKGEDAEISRTVADEDAESIFVDYNREGLVFEIQLYSGELPANPFVDVVPGKFYETPVLWAVENEVTNGMDATHFAPNDKCTRAQVVTFLWRAAGSPEPTSNENPFVDVVEGKFYYKAVLWAVEEGITNGVDATHFGTNNECTRGHVATFLWRTLGKPSATGSNPFEDVPAGKFYYDAVLWAAESGVTTGVSEGKFDPSGTCTRGQIVTFLYRALG